MVSTMKTHLEKEPHIGLALYGMRVNGIRDVVKRMYEQTIAMFDRLGCAPDLADADVHGKTNGNYKRFKHVDKKVRIADFDGVTYWTLVDVPTDLEDRLPGGQLSGENVSGCINFHPLADYFVFHVRQRLIESRIDLLFDFARSACEMLYPSYGIVYRRLFRFSPTLYGMGMREGEGGYIGEDPESLRQDLATCSPDRLNMEYWRCLVRHRTYTLLRSVYPWSFLTSVQLAIRVGSVRLEEWIKQGPDRGTLSRFTNEITLWTVPDDRIWPVRNELWNAGVILDRKRHFEDVMDEYHIGEEEICKHYREGTPFVRRPRGPGLSAEEMKSNILAAFDGESSPRSSRSKRSRKKPAE